MELYAPQPAYKIYAFDRGWRILRFVTMNLFKCIHVSALGWFHKAGDMVNRARYENWYKQYALYVAVAGLEFGGATQYVSASIVAGLFVALYALILGVWATLSMLLMGILVACTFAYSRYHGIFFRCPQADCHREMPLPIFLCPNPNCHAEHTRLWPSIYGVLYHRCQCGTRLPTIGLLGRKKLTRLCPHCRRPLNTAVGRNLHVPIVGGPSTGKTNYITMAMQEFKNCYESQHRYSITFTDPIDRQHFTANTQRLSQGRELVKTTDLIPQAYTLSIKAPRAVVPTVAYIYDPAGEAFNTSEYTDSQVYYKYIDGIIFVIDPCAIPAYHKIHEGDIELLRDSLRPSDLDIMQTYERMKQMFEASVGLLKGRRYSHPIAVVITKVDALELENEVGAPAVRALMESDPSIPSEEAAMSIVVRDFLYNYGLDHFVRELELHFSNVRYFSCSALGRLPTQDDSSSFTPVRVMDPLLWLLMKTKAIKATHKLSRPTSPLPEAVQETTPLVMEQAIQWTEAGEEEW